MQPRTIAVGDIHGHCQALDAVLAIIDPQTEDTLVFLGDYVDRGPDSRGVLETVIGLGSRCHVVALMGNHEEMMLGARQGGKSDLRFWLQFGGQQTLDSYGQNVDVKQIPWEHIRFLESLPLYFETDTHFFVHANYAPKLPLDRQSSADLLWRPLDEIPSPHFSGKTAIVGHTPQPNGQILDLDYLKCVETGCGFGGLLTALDVTSGQIWQVAENGKVTTRVGGRAGIE